MAAVTVAFLLGGSAYAYVTLSREREYRRLVEAGNAALAADQTFEAIEAFSGAIALKGDSMLAYLRRGETYHRQGQLQAAERDLRRAWRLDPTATRPLEELGDVHFELRNYARAADRYSDYIAIDDRSPRLLYKLALARYRAGSPAGGIDPLVRALALDAQFADAQYLLGLCFRATNHPEQALHALETAVSIAPALIAAREQLASLYEQTGHVDQEIDQLEALSSLDPRPVRRIALGLAQARAGRSNQAVLTLGQAAERYPESGGVYVALGRVWLQTAQGGKDRIALGKALEALQGNAASSDTGPEAQALLGRALLQAKQVELAERVLQQAVTKLPVDPQAFVDLADAAEQLGHLADARTALLKYRALVGDDPDAARQARWDARIGELSLRLGDYPTASDWLARAADGAPSGRLLGELAQAQVGAGRTDAARDTVARGLEIEPRNRTLLAISRKLR
jgi:tetratricopeptide (TPR) repeat protein